MAGCYLRSPEKISLCPASRWTPPPASGTRPGLPEALLAPFPLRRPQERSARLSDRRGVRHAKCHQVGLLSGSQYAVLRGPSSHSSRIPPKCPHRLYVVNHLLHLIPQDPLIQIKSKGHDGFKVTPTHREHLGGAGGCAKYLTHLNFTSLSRPPHESHRLLSAPLTREEREAPSTAVDCHPSVGHTANLSTDEQSSRSVRSPGSMVQ